MVTELKPAIDKPNPSLLAKILSNATLLIDFKAKPRILDSIQNGIIITDEHSRTIYTNPAFTRITGYSAAEMLGKNPGILHSGKHKNAFYTKMWKSILTKGFWEGEIWNRRKSGQVFPEFLTISKVTLLNSEHVFYFAIFSDLTFLKKDIEKKLHLAYYDPLTHLPNRTLYLDRLHHVTRHKKTPAKKVAILFMDLDKFKNVNDQYGHCMGDKLLRIVGKRLSSLMRPGDTIARMGGDEFTAIIEYKDKEAVNALATRISEAINQPFVIDDHVFNISISIGISYYPEDAITSDKLLKMADKNMYGAKSRPSVKKALKKSRDA